MIGARGVVRVDLQHHLLTHALDCLEIPKQKWTGIIASTVRASVEALAYMIQISFSISRQSSNFDADDPKSSCASHENLLSVGRKRKVQRDSDDLRALQIRWKRIYGDRNGDRRPPLPPT